MKRCFGEEKKYYQDYHDFEWGKPCYDDTKLFEFIVLEGAQAGLSWDLILRKRAGYRDAFHQFDVQKVADMSDGELEELQNNPNIIRNRLKINSARNNAKVFIQIQKEFGSFSHYLWAYVNHQPIINHWTNHNEVPTTTPLSDAISKDLKKRGMKFVGSTIIYAYMQAVGLVNDHLITCPQYQN